MANKKHTDKHLPPPVEMILIYAADGLAANHGHYTPANRPKTPERGVWLPMFRRLVETKDGLNLLHDLAKAGMISWHCVDADLLHLEDAFHDISFKARAISALNHLEDTAVNHTPRLHLYDLKKLEDAHMNAKEVLEFKASLIMPTPHFHAATPRQVPRVERRSHNALRAHHSTHSPKALPSHGPRRPGPIMGSRVQVPKPSPL